MEKNAGDGRGGGGRARLTPERLAKGIRHTGKLVTDLVEETSSIAMNLMSARCSGPQSDDCLRTLNLIQYIWTRAVFRVSERILYECADLTGQGQIPLAPERCLPWLHHCALLANTKLNDFKANDPRLASKVRRKSIDAFWAILDTVYLLPARLVVATAHTSSKERHQWQSRSPY